MKNRTIKNELNDKGGEGQLKQLRSIWQGYEESNLALRFWRPLY